MEQVVGAAVQARAGHDVIARAGQVQDGERLRGLPRRQEQRGHTALERGDALLDDVGGGVADPGVDIARNFQSEQGGGVRGVVEGVRRGRIDRQSPGVGGRIRVLTSVYLFGFERPMRGRIGVGAIAVGAHELSPSGQGPVMADPRLPRSRRWLLNLVITRGTPPRLEGCRPASRGLTLALMTDSKPSAWQLLSANSKHNSGGLNWPFTGR